MHIQCVLKINCILTIIFHAIYGTVCLQLAHSLLMIVSISTLLIIIIKLEVWIISHSLGLVIKQWYVLYVLLSYLKMNGIIITCAAMSHNSGAVKTQNTANWGRSMEFGTNILIAILNDLRSGHMWSVRLIDLICINPRWPPSYSREP